MTITNQELQQLESTTPGLKTFLTNWFDEWHQVNPIGLQSDCADDLYQPIRDFFTDNKSTYYDTLQQNYNDDSIMVGLFVKYWHESINLLKEVD